jgi:hypothetical protein
MMFDYKIADEILSFSLGFQSVLLIKQEEMHDIPNSTALGYWKWLNEGSWITAQSCSVPY